jgi:geranylgeranyl pyrophosphate synthase
MASNVNFSARLPEDVQKYQKWLRETRGEAAASYVVAHYRRRIKEDVEYADYLELKKENKK